MDKLSSIEPAFGVSKGKGKQMQNVVERVFSARPRAGKCKRIICEFVETVESGAAHNAAFLLKRLILIE